MEKTVNITINSFPVKIEKGKTILDAAYGIGIKIPTPVSYTHLAPMLT